MNDASVTARMSPAWREYLELCKPRVVALIVFTAIVGMLLSTPGTVPLDIFVFATLGIALAAGSAAAINHVAEYRIDALMARTQDRPLPQGEMTRSHALIFALLIGALAMYLLVAFVNVLTAVLTFASLIGYAVVYTMYLKHATPQNIVIGGAAGAAPPVLGWTAVTGSVDPHALLLFLGFSNLSSRRVRESVSSDVANYPRGRLHPCSNLALHDNFDHRDDTAVCDLHVWPGLFDRSTTARCGLSLLRYTHDGGSS